MGIARGWEKRVIRRNITYAKRTVRIFSVSPQSRSLFSASFQTFCLTARAYLNTQKYGPQSRSLFSASFQTFCLTARAYLNTQKYGLFCSLIIKPHWFNKISKSANGNYKNDDSVTRNFSLDVRLIVTPMVIVTPMKTLQLSHFRPQKQRHVNFPDLAGGLGHGWAATMKTMCEASE